MTGGREEPGEAGHGAVGLRRSFEDWVSSQLSAEDREVFRSVDVDPVVVIDQEVKLNRLMAYKVRRRLRELEMVREVAEGWDGTLERSSEVMDLEGTLLRISGRLARLMEVRVRYSELAENRANRDDLARALRGMDQEVFQSLLAEPHRFPELAAFHGVAEA